MTGTTEIRLQAIRSRTRQYRARHEARQLSCLTACSLSLTAGILLLMHSVQSPGVAAVPGGYGAVLLRNGTGAYIVVGLLAFVLGVTATLLCIRLRVRAAKRTDDDESTD